jgi:hypothetical protein
MIWKRHAGNGLPRRLKGFVVLPHAPANSATVQLSAGGILAEAPPAKSLTVIGGVALAIVMPVVAA